MSTPTPDRLKDYFNDPRQPPADFAQKLKAYSDDQLVEPFAASVARYGKVNMVALQRERQEGLIEAICTNPQADLKRRRYKYKMGEIRRRVREVEAKSKAMMDAGGMARAVALRARNLSPREQFIDLFGQDAYDQLLLDARVTREELE